MSYYFLIPLSLLLGAVGLAAFFWCLKSNQYEDLEGAAERILYDESDDATRAANVFKSDESI